jgi:hypothetical protein
VLCLGKERDSLQAGRSRVRFPLRLMDLWPLGSTQPLTEMNTRNLRRSKVPSACKADNLIAICEPIL